MRILLLSRHAGPHIGGTEAFITQFFELTRNIDNLHIEAVLLLPPEGRYPQLPPRVRITYVDAPTLFALLWRFKEGTSLVANALLLPVTSLRLALRGFWVTKREAVDLIYAVGGPIALAAGVVLKHLTGLPLAVHFHTLRRDAAARGLRRYIIFSLYSQVDALIGNCEAFRTDAIAIGIDPHKCHAVWNWVDSSEFAPRSDRAELRRSLQLKMGQTAFLYAGRLEAWKQADRIISALEQFNDPRAVFYFAGDGEFRADLDRLASKNSNVRVLGFRDKTELQTLYNACDFLLWGSVDIDYPSLVIMEAMICGLPVITAKTTMNPLYPDERVQAAAFGYPKYVSLFDSSSAGILCGIQRAIDQREHYKFMRAEISQYARRVFGTRNAAKLLKILRSLCEEATQDAL